METLIADSRPTGVDGDGVEDRIWDAVVVGAGPAGSLAARELARAGASVVLVDKMPFPRPKVCGACLNPAARSVLERVGLDDVPARLSAQSIDRFEWHATPRRVAIPLTGHVAVGRDLFDEALMRAACDAGAVFLPGAMAMRLGDDATRRRLWVQHDGRTRVVRARVIIAASGLGSGWLRDEPACVAVSMSDSRIGLGATIDDRGDGFSDGALRMLSAKNGYLGMISMGNGRITVAAALDASLLQTGGPAHAIRVLLRQAGCPELFDPTRHQWHGTPKLTGRPRRVAADRLFLIGDAAGYVEPFTGEGIAWALATGAAVAPVALAAIECWRPALADAWVARHRRLVAQRQWWCQTIRRGLRFPGLTRAALSLLRRAPIAADAAARWLGRPFAESEFDPSVLQPVPRR